ncbi:MULTISPECIES: tetratricopeptide repeat protein [unclassified Nocardia]|uniref:tetratricopeptide repeat protein n=1 Tax=unclassified Nocardia TaxID=2637762 RepID=UPI001CE3FB20|nr:MULTISPECIES: tetratricopeptide repeat protein [unclassified Nocardia]
MHEVPRQIPPRNRNHVNREPQLQLVERLVRDASGNKVIVLSGAHGVGKTALAIESVHYVKQVMPDRFSDGQLFLPLSIDGVSASAADLLGVALTALGDPYNELPDRLDARYNRYVTKTQGRQLCVVLDGALTAGQLKWLEPGDGNSVVLVTARTAATDLSRGATAIDVEELPAAAARELLGRIAGAHRIEREPEAADRLLTLCGNVPSAILVVGGTLAENPGWSISRLADLMSDDGRRAEVLELSEIYDAAYRSLPDTAQRCYRALGARSYAGWIRTPVLAAALELPVDEIDWTMLKLVRMDLVREFHGGYRVGELVRVHARGVDRDPNRDEYLAIGNRLVEYYDRAIRFADVLLAPGRPWRALLLRAVQFPGPGVGEFDDAASAREWLRQEIYNIAAAAEFASRAGKSQLVARWCVLLWSFHEKDKYLDTMRAMHLLALEAPQRSQDPAVESLLHSQLGFLYYWRRELPEAVSAFGSAVELARALPRSMASRQLEASGLEGRGLVLLAWDRLDDALADLRLNYRQAEEIGDVRRIAIAAMHLAKIEEPARALELLSQAERVFAASADDETENRAKTEGWRGRALLRLGRIAEAETALRSALTVLRARRRRFDEAEFVVALGACLFASGDVDGALEQHRIGLGIYEELCFTIPAQAVAERISAMMDGRVPPPLRP